MAPVPVHAVDRIGVACVGGERLLRQSSAASVHPPLLRAYQQYVPLILEGSRQVCSSPIADTAEELQHGALACRLQCACEGSYVRLLSCHVPCGTMAAFLQVRHSAEWQESARQAHVAVAFAKQLQHFCRMQAWLPTLWTSMHVAPYGGAALGSRASHADALTALLLSRFPRRVKNSCRHTLLTVLLGGRRDC